MSEAWGSIVLRLPGDLADLFMEDGEEISVSSMNTLFEYAGLESISEYPEIAEVDGFPLEEEPKFDDEEYLLLDVFGSAWMEVCKVIVTYGEELELYGSIQDEYRVTEFYSLNDLGERYFDVHDGDSSSSKTEARQDWLDTIAGDVLEEFGDVFEDEDAEDDDDLDDDEVYEDDEEELDEDDDEFDDMDDDDDDDDDDDMYNDDDDDDDRKG